MKARNRFGQVAFYLPVVALSLFFIIFEVLRAVRVPFTPDEAGTLRKFVSANIFAVFNFGSANNHFLNTLLAKGFYSLAGPSKFVLRLPNLLAYLLYLGAGFLILKRFVRNRWLVVGGFLLLNVNPYVLDFFSLSRGYGLSLGFLLAGLYFFFSFLEKTAPQNQEDLRSLYLSLAAVGLAVLSNFVLLNVYISLAIFAFVFFVVQNVRQQPRGPETMPVARKHRGRFVLPAFLILAAVFFNLAVMSQDFGLAGRFFEPVTVRIFGLEDPDGQRMQVLRIDSQNLEAELPRSGEIWKMGDPIYFKAIKFRCPPELLSRIRRIEIRIGPQKFTYDAVDIKKFQVLYGDGLAVFMAKKSASLKRSQIPAFRPMINWKGDSIFLKALAWRILLAAGIAGVVAALVFGIGWLVRRGRILTGGQYRGLALPTLLLGSFIAYPLAILKKSGELYYGGQEGFIRDSVFSLIHNSFYGASYFPWQEKAAGLFVLLSIGAFLLVLVLLYRKRNLAGTLPGLAIFSFLCLVSVLILVQRFIFRNPYPLGRTALFLIPLFTLLVIFLAQYTSHLKRSIGLAAAVLLIVITLIAGYHFFKTANTALTLDWEREAVILGWKGQPSDILDTSGIYGYMK